MGMAVTGTIRHAFRHSACAFYSKLIRRHVKISGGHRCVVTSARLLTNEPQPEDNVNNTDAITEPNFAPTRSMDSIE